MVTVEIAPVLWEAIDLLAEQKRTSISAALNLIIARLVRDALAPPADAPVEKTGT
jgi:hypothetical protein